MSAPANAEPIGPPAEGEDPLPDFTCEGCGYHGNGSELLGVDPDEDSTLWCPVCGCSGWVKVRDNNNSNKIKIIIFFLS
jgi:hypothetical protein